MVTILLIVYYVFSARKIKQIPVQEVVLNGGKI